MAWLQETDLRSAKQNVVEFILGTQERLRHALDVADEQVTQERFSAKRWCDRPACQRTFQRGDKVLVLLPIPGNSLQAKFYRPYIIEQKLGPVDYIVSTPDRRKTKRVCHVNLLKQYHERDPCFVTCVTTEPVIVAHETVPDEIKTSSTVSDILLQQFSEEPSESKTTDTPPSDVVPDKPVRTSTGMHHFELRAQLMICTPCWLHPACLPDYTCVQSACLRLSSCPGRHPGWS